MNRRKTMFTVAAAAAFALAGIGGATAGVTPQAAPQMSSSGPAFGLAPFTVAQDSACTGTNAGNVKAEWDTSTGNGAPSILLQKNTPTTAYCAAGVDIVTPLEGGPVSKLTELNFDYKTGEHCGAGAPRFNIQTNTGTSVLLGCIYGTHTDLQNGWTHVEFSATDITNALPAGSTTLQDLYIIFDEGNDTPISPTVGTPGTVHIDNISVNNDVVGDPTPTTADDCKNGGYKNFTPAFKNQGDCVSFVATKAKNPPSVPKPPKQG